MGPLSVSRENLAELRARHTAGKSDPMQMRTPPLDEVQSIDNRLDDERRMRTSLKRERRLRLQEQSERLAGIKSALAKTVGMQAEGALGTLNLNYALKWSLNLSDLNGTFLRERKPPFVKR